MHCPFIEKSMTAGVDNTQLFFITHDISAGLVVSFSQCSGEEVSFVSISKLFFGLLFTSVRRSSLK